MANILAGQARHLLTLGGGAVGATGAANGSAEEIIGGIALALLGHAWSWLSKRGQ